MSPLYSVFSPWLFNTAVMLGERMEMARSLRRHMEEGSLSEGTCLEKLSVKDGDGPRAKKWQRGLGALRCRCPHKPPATWVSPTTRMSATGGGRGCSLLNPLSHRKGTWLGPGNTVSPPLNVSGSRGVSLGAARS